MYANNVAFVTIVNNNISVYLYKRNGECYGINAHLINRVLR